MDRDGVDVQIMCRHAVLFSYQRPPAQGLECARLFNDAAREICAHAPRRLKSCARCRWQDTDLACRELSRAMAEGHVGVHIGQPRGRARHQRRGDHHLLQHCAAEGAAVFVHPWDMMAQDRLCPGTSSRGWWPCRQKRSCRSCG